jgi:secondary thiamine-phosphate synthase enzyme
MEYEVETKANEVLVEITELVKNAVIASKIKDGICLVYTPHTTCAVTVNENADSDVRVDILASLNDQVKDPGFMHAEGNSAAHVKSSLLGCSQSFLVEGGRPVLGQWQGIFLAEFDGPRSRKVFVKVMGE